MKLTYNATTRKTSNSPGVLTRVPGFGNTSSVEWLDPSEMSPTKYFYNIGETLVKKLNYTRGIDLHGAPYDFRKAPSIFCEVTLYTIYYTFLNFQTSMKSFSQI
jgi:lysophospholipase III